MKSITHCITTVISLLIVLWACAPISTPAPISVPTSIPVPGGKLIIGYYPSWAAERNVFVKDNPAHKLTHINYAFSNVSADGECILGDPAADVERIHSAA